MTPDALRTFLHTRIPLTVTMAVDVVVAQENCVTLSAPLEPNVNHRQTVFGGSASSLAILAAWSLVYLRLQREGLALRIVIQKNTVTYERPITGAFTATAQLDDAARWTRFRETLQRRGRARVHVGSVLRCNGEQVGTLDAAFVAERLPPNGKNGP